MKFFFLLSILILFFPNYSYTQQCGNSAVETPEECDDGNLENLDGCSMNCTIENGWFCANSPSQASLCTTICGDNMTIGPETCDDGNNITTDGCQNCRRSPGYLCSGEPSVCQLVCGNGLIESQIEDCDDGNNITGDGCTFPGCRLNPAFECSGEPSVCTPRATSVTVGDSSEENSILGTGMVGDIVIFTVIACCVFICCLGLVVAAVLKIVNKDSSEDSEGYRW